MANIKDVLMTLDVSDDRSDENAVEVYADSVAHALELASKDLGIDVTLLDYQIIEKGTRGIMGIGRVPYRVLVTPLADRAEQAELSALERKLTREHTASISPKADADGTFHVRVIRSGIWLTVTPPRGKGAPVTLGRGEQQALFNEDHAP